MNANGPKRVLIVDDDDDARLVAQLGIALVTDWEARSAASHDEALACCREWQPEAVLLETAMPDCDVSTTLDSIRRAATDGEIAVVLVAHPQTSADTLDAHGRSVEGVLHKPLDLLAVGAQLAALLGWPQSN